jgi:hypothetical protein
MRSLLLLVGAFALCAGLARAADKEPPAAANLGSVRVEARGKLLRKDNAYYVEAADVSFPDTKVLVRLERSEDKNRQLDALLERLEGKPVIVEGYLDCRRVGDQERVLWLYVSKEDQIKPANGN